MDISCQFATSLDSPEHIAAAAPVAVDKDQVPQDKVEKEKRIFVEQVKESGKPDHLIEKIVAGKIEAYYKDVALVHQAWVREPTVVNVHDFPGDALGRAVPYGVYDLTNNRGLIYLGTSGDTAAFAADARERQKGCGPQ